jgi:hypothetical protein
LLCKPFVKVETQRQDLQDKKTALPKKLID